MKLCYRVVHYNHTQILVQTLLCLYFTYIYPCFQKTAMNANAKPALLRIARDLCHKAYFCWFLKQKVNSFVVYLGITFSSLNKYLYSANTVLLAYLNASNYCKASGKKYSTWPILLFSEEYSVAHKQSTENRGYGRSYSACRDLALFKVHFKYTFITRKRVASTGAMFTCLSA